MRIVLDNVKKSFIQAGKKVSVLNGISTEFHQGKTYAIMGVSGTGKSTLLQLIGGLELPSSGHIYIDGVDISTFTQSQKQQFLHATIGFIFQQPFLMRELTVLENVTLKGIIGGYSREFCRERGLALLKRVNLTRKADEPPAALSGGEQQRVAIARALFLQPKFLLADEPTAHVDEAHRETILELLQELVEESGAGLLVSSHDKVVAQRMEHVYALHDGLLKKLDL